eukprot:4851744-Lingulodinium_polyedra.AAC.1
MQFFDRTGCYNGALQNLQNCKEPTTAPTFNQTAGKCKRQTIRLPPYAERVPPCRWCWTRCPST